MLRKYKENVGIEFTPFSFNSTTETVINLECDRDKSFQEILYRIGNWISEGPGPII